MPLDSTENARAALEQELARRVNRNPRYSMRSFARTLGLSHTMVSLVLSGKRPVSRKMKARMAELGLAPNPRPHGPDDDGMDALTDDTFALLADWYHLAVLSLLEIPGARFEARWIAKRLGISIVEARLAISRLKRLRLVASRNGRYRQCTRPLKMENKKMTAASRRFQQGILRKAEESVDLCPDEWRDLSSTTLAIHPRHVPYARQRIQEFRRQLTRELEAMGEPTEVYHLAVQIYPVTRKEETT